MSSSPVPEGLLGELKSLTRHGSIYSAGGLLGKFVGFLMIPLYTHYLSPADYGTLELLDLSVALFSLAVMMWMNSAIIRYYNEYEDQKNKNEVISTVLISAAVLGVLSAAAGIVFAKELSMLILKSPGYYKFFWLLSITFCFSTLNSVSFTYLRAKQRSAFVSISGLVTMVLSLSLNAYFIVVLKSGVIGILYSSLITMMLSAITLTVMTVREVKLGFSFQKLFALAVFGAPLVITSLAAFALNFSDRFFLQRLTSVSAVGIYALGYKFGFMLSFLIVQPFDMIWSSRMYEIAKKPNGPALFARIFRYYSLVLVIVGLGLSLAIKEVIGILAAPSFRDAYKIVPVIALAYIFQGSYRFMIGGIYIKKKTYAIGMISAVSLVLNLFLNYVLIKRFGGMGAAWATAFSFLFMAGLSYFVSEKLYSVPYYVRPFILSLAVAAILYWCAVKIPFPSMILSAGAKTLIFLSFPIVLYVGGFFSEDEVKKVRQMAQYLWATCRCRAAILPER